MVLLIKRRLTALLVGLSLATAEITSSLLAFTDTASPVSITTYGTTIASDAWADQEFNYANAFSGVPDSEYSTCSEAYFSQFVSWARIHSSNWVTYGTETDTITENGTSVVTTTNTWYEPLGAGIGYQPNYTPPCCGVCQIQAWQVRLYYWQNLTASNEAFTTTAIIEDKYTATYPSAFLVFPNVTSLDSCTQSSTELGYEINTASMYFMAQRDKDAGQPGGVVQGFGSFPFNYWSQYTLCTSLKAAASDTDYISTATVAADGHTYVWNPCIPEISAPPELFSAYPGWDKCQEVANDYRGAYDPPHTLVPQPSLAMSTTAAPASSPTPPGPSSTTSSTPATADPQSSSAPSGPSSVSSMQEPSSTSSSSSPDPPVQPSSSSSSDPPVQPSSSSSSDPPVQSSSSSSPSLPLQSSSSSFSVDPTSPIVIPPPTSVASVSPSSSPSTQPTTSIPADGPTPSSNALVSSGGTTTVDSLSSNALIGPPSSSEALISPAGPTTTPLTTILELGTSPVTLSTDSTGGGQIIAGSVTVSQGGPAATIGGTVVSLGSSDLVIGTNTQNFNPGLTVATTTLSGSSGGGIGGAIISAWTAAGGNASVAAATSTSISIETGFAPAIRCGFRFLAGTLFIAVLITM